jgi:hypothetical protein
LEPLVAKGYHLLVALPASFTLTSEPTRGLITRTYDVSNPEHLQAREDERLGHEKREQDIKNLPKRKGKRREGYEAARKAYFVLPKGTKYENKIETVRGATSPKLSVSGARVWIEEFKKTRDRQHS